MKKFFITIFILSLFCLAGCPSPVNIESETEPETDNQQSHKVESDANKKIKQIQIEFTESDFATGWDWETRVEIPANAFSIMNPGDFLIFVTESSETPAEYFQLKLNAGEDVYLGEGSEIKNNGIYDSEYHTITLDVAQQQTNIYPTDENLQSLKINGLTITGYGVKLTKIIINHYTVFLSDKNATSNAINLFSYLLDMYGKQVITGQMENAWNNDFNQLGKVYEKTDKYPALMGFDFMNYTGTSWDASTSNKQIERAINFWNGKDYNGNRISTNHGIVAFCWHWHDPLHKDFSYKIEDSGGTSFRIPYDTTTKQWKTESAEYKGIIEDFDVIASQLLRLQNAGVPVIWRPLHEGAGNVGLYENKGTAWFWWGAGNSTDMSVMTNEDICGECYVALWKLMYDYFTNEKGLHNLIWLWNGQNIKFYPGADYVDIIGDDIYTTARDYSSQKSVFLKYQAMDKTKLVTLSECGVMPSPEECIKEGASWSFFMVWNDSKNEEDDSNFWNSEKYNDDNHKREVYESEYAITLDELPDFTN